MDAIFQLESLEIFTNVICKEILINLYDSKQVTHASVEPLRIQAAKEEMRKLLSNSNFNLSTLAESVNSKGWNQDKVDCFLSLLEERKSELLYAALIHHHITHGEIVTDFNWLLKLVLGTNELKSLKYPILQLIFSTVNSDGEQKQRIVDINKEMLAKLINVLENVEINNV